ncbi:VanZ family protein [Erysipelothrix urinaevulpis]|uniref:VanZ family protein n=1 Tax=Erysipelothrix urinaevulpis TaxID=2683717 RepID=UPI0013585474|nr:VanZ family protein [Erysipelothrix urinaevulpis]
MSAYLEPIKIALFLFPVLSFFISLPYMIYQYHTYGSVNRKRTVIIYSFIFYLMVAYFLVILPLPDRASVTSSYQEMMQLRPFAFVRDFFTHTTIVISDPKTYLSGLTQGVVTQPVFNVLMTIPFGMMLRFYFKKSLKEVFVYSFLLSLFFELTQLTGLYGIYSGPYRLFDIDDLMLNTMGGSIGYFLSPLIGIFFPSREAIDEESYLSSSYVSYVRRFVSFLGDMVFIKIFMLGFQIILALFKVYLVEGEFSTNCVEFVLLMLYFVVFVYKNQGQTVMQKFLHIKLSSTKEELKLSQILKRFLLIYVFMIKFSEIFAMIQSIVLVNQEPNIIALIMYLGVFFIVQTTIVFHIVFTAIKKTHVMFYDQLSGTRIISQAVKK